MSPYDDGWMLELEMLSAEIQLNDPRTVVVASRPHTRQPPEPQAQQSASDAVQSQNKPAR